MTPLLLVAALGVAPCEWPLWNAYLDQFVSADGRVIDPARGGITTSEGQSYALFFSLVMNDKPRFLKLLDWTRDNLAGGRLEERLPAYKWGRREGGSWGVLDGNSAADSDLWIGYSLIEAGRLWNDGELSRLGRALLGNLVLREVAQLPGLGAMLLPAPRGFAHGRKWRLNPSYLPLQLLSGLESEGVPGPWRELRENAVKMLAARGQRGFVEDWVGYQPRAGFVADPVRGAIGSYDAIRVYLWHGMLDPRDRALELNGPYDYWRARGQVPEKVDTRHPAAAARPGPVGFLAALLPEIARRGNGEELARLQAQIERARHQRLYGQPPAYYDQNLILFAQGYLESRYHFSRDGRLSSGCGSTATQP